MGMELTGVKFGHPMIPSPPSLIYYGFIIIIIIVTQW